MKKYIVALCAAAPLAIASPAQALTVIDFDAGITGPSYTEQGVTFTPASGGVFTQGFGNTPNGTAGLIVDPLSSFIEAVISGGTDFVSIDLGDFGADADDIFLRAYDAGNSLLGSDTFTIPGGFTGMETLSVSFANIARVEFGGSGFQGDSNVYADNFSFNQMGGAVPEPATWAFMILGFGAIGGAMRRQRKANVKVSYA